jgi:cardiolipin synthase
MALSSGALFLPVLIAIVAGVSDFLDGFLARRFGAESRIGALLDPLADKVFCNFAMFSLCACCSGPRPFFVILMAGLLLVRDLLLISGAVYAVSTGLKIDMRPVYTSKLCTSAIFTFAILSLIFGTGSQVVTLLGGLCVFLIISSAVVYATRFKSHMFHVNHPKS